jgi:hypothetical protein
MASGDGNDKAAAAALLPARIRRKQKDGNQFSPPSSLSSAQSGDESDDDGGDVIVTASPSPPVETEEAPIPPEAPKQNVVVMQVQDIRDVVSGAPKETPVAPVAVYDDGGEDNDEKLADDDKELADDKEWEYYDVDKDGNKIVGKDEPLGGG